MPDKDEYICGQCSKINPTCCRLLPGAEKFCFPLSRSEIEAISSYLNSKDFYVSQESDRDFIARLVRMLPLAGKVIYNAFILDNCHNRLKTYQDGSCVLLGEKGCTLPVDLRPVYCRMYPFWFQDKTLTFMKDPGCLAQSRAANTKELLRVFNVSPLELKTLFKTMLDNIKKT